MTTPASGQISISQIQTAFARGNNLNAYRSTSWFSPAGTTGTFSAGAIAMSDFYSKAFGFAISSNQTNANLRTLAISAGWNQSTPVIAIINSGIYISSSSTGTPALTISGSFPGGVWLSNDGYIVGKGGAGGRGSNGNTFQDPAVAGSSGGLALSVTTAITIRNNQTIGGGGGGGGGGGQNFDLDDGTRGWGGGGGGGGRSGLTNSSGGAAGDYFTEQYSRASTVGGDGTSFAAGAGGLSAAAPNPNYAGGNGGSGGTWGASGATGSTGGVFGFVTAGAAGGAAGAAISGNVNITWLAFGTRLGAIT